jgi:hypothetical protein
MLWNFMYITVMNFIPLLFSVSWIPNADFSAFAGCMAPPILSFLEMAGGMFHGEPLTRIFSSLFAKHPSTMIIKR